jgi:tetratricopeptide (TPR) repeat protein
MTATASFTKGLAEVTSLMEGEEYDRALKRLDELRKTWPGNAHLHLLWGRLVQLQDHPTHALSEVKRALQHALDLDKHSPAAAIELGHFCDNVDDDPQAASKLFAHGVTAARQSLIEALHGQAKALLQLDKRDEAVRCLIEALHLADAERSSRKGFFAERIEELLKELGQLQSA